jgi:hypothetical protein
MPASVTITVVAGGMTFVNEWYQTKNIDWKVPVATVVLAAAMDGFSKVSNGAATALSVIIFLGAATTQFNGKSTVDTITDLLGNTKTSAPAKSVSKISNQGNPNG